MTLTIDTCSPQFVRENAKHGNLLSRPWECTNTYRGVHYILSERDSPTCTGWDRTITGFGYCRFRLTIYILALDILTRFGRFIMHVVAPESGEWWAGWIGFVTH